jgi:hypothetical protein
VTRHSDTDAALQELYDQIPAIPDCKGRCWVSCGAIEMSDRERQRIRSAGYRITPAQEALANLDTFWCEALAGDGRCAVYEMRPLVCRLWGAVEDMPCPYGCRPERMLTSEEGMNLVMQSLAIGGDPTGLIGSTADADAAMAAWRANRNGMRHVYDDAMQRGRRGVLLRLDELGEELPAAITRRTRKKKIRG